MRYDRESPTRTVVREQLPPIRLMHSYDLALRTPGREAQRRTISEPCIRIGSRAGNDICLADDAVSRLHCEILTEDSGYRLRDLGSRNGTYVDGCRIVDVYLRAGSRIELGNCELLFQPLEDEVEIAASAEGRFGALVGASVVMRELFAMLTKVAPSEATILIEGETGTGKELVAEALHAHSARSGGPFVVFDCAAVADGLLESELFGHEKGAFTGADSRHIGRLQEAEGGTLFIDELGELPVDLQPKFLRALEQREFRRIGSNSVLPANVRVVAATNRDLAVEVNRGSFREDLYYRIAVVRLRLPPLRERREDIKLLVDYFLRQSIVDPLRATRVLEQISSDNWARLQRHPFRGNVRELRNLVERALVLGSDEIGAPMPGTTAERLAEQRDLAPLFASRPAIDVPEPDLDWALVAQKNELTARFERRYLRGMLDRYGGNISQAARAASMDRMYFKRLMRKHGL